MYEKPHFNEIKNSECYVNTPGNNEVQKNMPNPYKNNNENGEKTYYDTPRGIENKNKKKDEEKKNNIFNNEEKNIYINETPSVPSHDQIPQKKMNNPFCKNNNKNDDEYSKKDNKINNDEDEKKYRNETPGQEEKKENNYMKNPYSKQNNIKEKENEKKYCNDTPGQEDNENEAKKKCINNPWAKNKNNQQNNINDNNMNINNIIQNQNDNNYQSNPFKKRNVDDFYSSGNKNGSKNSTNNSISFERFNKDSSTNNIPHDNDYSCDL
jgi:hypothetical protein